ncbi:DUF1150 family protein [Litoreibacter albidus]|uniref:DUF1150 family protein n=1 Tax=Litoreibacter albidus TaxID=670155 RepID=A0A1H2Z9B5_9RHOB|nr:DUF1150 family protein [Litoreibacter albidus]SDX13917.1 hypothetical protein SAMN04488001_2484 [Litoreibacter albidus]
MDTQIDLKSLGGDARIVYVRAVDAAELSAEVLEELDGAKQLYAVHAADGERLAVVQDRDVAFLLARQNDYAPVTVH